MNHRNKNRQKQLMKSVFCLNNLEAELNNLIDRYLIDKEIINILDLGNGASSKAMPMAEKLKKSQVKIYFVDQSKALIDQLKKDCQKYAMTEQIIVQQAEIEKYSIAENKFDLIIADHVLNHLASFDDLMKILEAMMKGTRNNGLNYLHLITDEQEEDLKTGKVISQESQINYGFDKCQSLLKTWYHSWRILTVKKSLSEKILFKKGKKIKHTANNLMFIARKQLA